jgi:hypothetical protein
MGFLSDQLQGQIPVPRWLTCKFCQSQVRKTRDDGFCSLLCRKRWDAEKAAVDRLNTEYKSADEIIAAMDARLKPRRK